MPYTIRITLGSTEHRGHLITINNITSGLNVEYEILAIVIRLDRRFDVSLIHLNGDPGDFFVCISFTDRLHFSALPI